MSEVEIIFEDDDILVINKPGGLGTQAPRQFDSLEARLQRYLRQSQHDGPSPYLGIPHRLDRCVSGAIVFAKRKKAAQRLSRQFERRDVRKTYLAMVHEHVTPEAGEWRDHMRKIPDRPQAEIVMPGQSDAKLAILHYEVVSRGSIMSDPTGRRIVSQLRIDLQTGRMHQIRLQCASRGFPIVGDLMYGSSWSGQQDQHPRDRKIALHAHEIQFVHPRTKQEMSFQAALPSSWPR